MASWLRASLRFISYLTWTALLLPIQIAAVALDHPLAVRLPVLYHRVCLRLIGLNLIARGEMASPGPVLFVSNHTSYLDISVFGALIPGSFVAKREVAAWPLFGLLAKLQRTVFVDRGERRQVHAQRSEMASRLERGGNLILFPEGTSDDGAHMRPFKSALLSAADIPVNGRMPLVQPVSIAYTRLDGMPMGRALRPFYAWYGDMSLAPHLWRVLGLGVATVEVDFHKPVTAAEFPSRKALTDYCRTKIAEGVARALGGRGADPPPPESGADAEYGAGAGAPGQAAEQAPAPAQP